MDPERNEKGSQDAAIVLPVVGTILLMPPIVLIFARPVLVFGVPLIVVFIFGVWAALVVGAFLVARRLERAESRRGPPPREAAGR